MMYYDQSRATYDEAVAFCANYGAQLVEIWNEDEWLKVKKGMAQNRGFN